MVQVQLNRSLPKDFPDVPAAAQHARAIGDTPNAAVHLLTVTDV